MEHTNLQLQKLKKGKNLMTLEQATNIIKMHDYHIVERTKARQQGDVESYIEHQACLTMMQVNYDKACKIVSKHNK